MGTLRQGFRSTRTPKGCGIDASLQQTCCDPSLCRKIRTGKLLHMSGEKNRAQAKAPAKGKSPNEAEWTRGLKRLYDSVVDEPMPDAFRDLLSKLDSDK